MKIRVKYFALLREAVGLDEEVLELAREQATVADVRQAAAGAHAEGFARVQRIRSAVNGTMASDTAVVHDGDEVAFFPPVTGG